MHRILSSSPESSSAASSFVIFFDFAFEAPFAGLGFGAGDEEALVCWPFVARPERRGSSVACVSTSVRVADTCPVFHAFWSITEGTLGLGVVIKLT